VVVLMQAERQLSETDPVAGGKFSAAGFPIAFDNVFLSGNCIEANTQLEDRVASAPAR